MKRVADLPKLAEQLGLTGVVWETSQEGTKFLRTPRDQALVVSKDLDVYELQFHDITLARTNVCTLQYGYTLGDGVDWSKLYQERSPTDFTSAEEMLIERETDLAIVVALRFGPKRSCAGLLFGAEENAQDAARAVHQALWSDGKLRLPLWAHHALAAGWTAPEGWQP